MESMAARGVESEMGRAVGAGRATRAGAEAGYAPRQRAPVRDSPWMRFRQHPELEAGGKLSIMGITVCTAEQMQAYAERRRADFPQVAGLYTEYGEKYGVRGDAAFCQMLLETRGWTSSRFALPVAGARTTPSWKPDMLSAWTAEEAIDSQMQLLRRYGMGPPARCWEDLAGRWPGAVYDRYGRDIAAIWRNMTEWAGERS